MKMHFSYSKITFELKKCIFEHFYIEIQFLGNFLIFDTIYKEIQILTLFLSNSMGKVVMEAG
jgi:hypothetical protein